MSMCRLPSRKIESLGDVAAETSVEERYYEGEIDQLPKQCENLADEDSLVQLASH